MDQSVDESDQVRRAILDYVEGFYDGNSKLSERSIRRDFCKRGFRWNPDDMRFGAQEFMDFGRLYEVVTRFRESPPPPDAVKRITIFEILEQTATAKLEAVWGVDFIHLAKYDGRWMVVNVVWQSTPSKK